MPTLYFRSSIGATKLVVRAGDPGTFLGAVDVRVDNQGTVMPCVNGLGQWVVSAYTWVRVCVQERGLHKERTKGVR